MQADYNTQPNYRSLSMEKTKYSRIKTNLNNTQPQIQPYRKYQKESHNTRNPTLPILPTITQTSSDPSQPQFKEGKHTNSTTRKKIKKKE